MHFWETQFCNWGTNVSSRLWLGIVLMLAGTVVVAQPEQRTTFKASLDLVSVAVVVRGPDGRLVPNLRQSDFEVSDRGVRQQIVQFQSGEDADARLALLVDSSGSMVLGSKLERSRVATDLLIAGFNGSDEASVFSFDSRVRRLTPFTRDPGTLRAAVTSVEPYGVTSLYDAIVDTVRTVSNDAPRARAVLLLTDGVDTGSLVSPQDAAQAAAALDIPLYVLSLCDEEGAKPAAKIWSGKAADAASLHDLAVRTGGLAAEAATIAQLSIATRTILTELRHQYVLAFPAAAAKGWHDLTVRVRKGRVHARSRDGYLVS
jgi:VWFA-related protein